jgi:diguanylate cyclase (GGDEF)-like protein
MELPAHYIIGCTDVSSIKKAEIELNRMAFHDALTDLGNRYLLNEQLAIELERAETSGRQMGLVFIDLDGFKLINDGMGHAMGDQLLKVVAQRIRETIRRADIPVRFGGDEFFIICPHSNEQDCTTMADRLLEKLEQPCRPARKYRGDRQHRHCPVSATWHQRRKAAECRRQRHVPGQAGWQAALLHLQ